MFEPIFALPFVATHCCKFGELPHASHDAWSKEECLVLHRLRVLVNICVTLMIVPIELQLSHDWHALLSWLKLFIAIDTHRISKTSHVRALLHRRLRIHIQ